jgi:transcriptional regulator with XRE-family HTH domain
MGTKSKFAARLASFRKQRGMSQLELATTTDSKQVGLQSVKGQPATERLIAPFSRALS